MTAQARATADRDWSDLERLCERIVNERERRLFMARCRARIRDFAQKTGTPLADVPIGAALIRRPDSWLPVERVMVISRGIRLSRERNWKDVVP